MRTARPYGADAVWSGQRASRTSSPSRVKLFGVRNEVQRADHAVDDVDRDDAVDHPVEDSDQPGLPADPLDAEVDVDVLRGDCGQEAQHLVAAEDGPQRRLALRRRRR